MRTKLKMIIFIKRQAMPWKPEKKRRQWVREYKPFERPRDFSWFYNRRKWKRFSILFREKNPFCVECLKQDIHKASEVTDHIRGLAFLLDNNLDAFSEDECQALCSSCHNKKSGSEAHRWRPRG